MVGSYTREMSGGAELFLTDRNTMDIRDAHRINEIFRQVRPSAVIHLAAETDVDRCQREPEHAVQSNETATINIAKACLENDCVLLYVSTLGVFDGMKPEPYTEEDQPSPINVYATTKVRGEQFIQQNLSRHFIVRTGWVFGGKEKDKKFVGKIAALCLANDGTKPINVVGDKFGNPTYARDLAAKMFQLLKTQDYGVYHVANEGACSRFAFAQEIAEAMGCDVTLEAVSSDMFPLPAPRPRSEAGMSCRLQQIGLGPMRPWRDALREYISTWGTLPLARGAAQSRNA